MLYTILLRTMDSTQIEDGASPILTLNQFPRPIHVRTYRASDVEALTKAANNKNVYANLTDRIPSPYTLVDSKWWINHNLDEANWRESTTLGRKVPLNYTITESTPDSDKDVCIGAIGLEFKSDVFRRTAELGYWLGEGYWGKRIMSEVVKAFVQWAWEAFGPEMVRLSANVFAWNEASVKVLQKAGFAYEGRQKLAVFKNGKLGDTIMLGLVRPGVQVG